MESIRQAYLLRGIVGDKENFFITYNYDRDVLRNFEICRQICESWIEKYPQDIDASRLPSGLTSKGTAQYEKSIEEAKRLLAWTRTSPLDTRILPSPTFSQPARRGEGNLSAVSRRKLTSKDACGCNFSPRF